MDFGPYKMKLYKLHDHQLYLNCQCSIIYQTIWYRIFIIVSDILYYIGNLGIIDGHATCVTSVQFSGAARRYLFFLVVVSIVNPDPIHTPGVEIR